VYIVRPIELKDLDDIFELSRLVTFINLPPDLEILKKLITKSVEAFERSDQDLSKNYYIFVCESLEQNKVIGASMIHAQHGTEKSPHYFLKTQRVEKYSETIKTGFIHGTLKLDFDTNGPTEIGGLVLHPEYRDNGEKLGKYLSFVRFFYMGKFKERFKDEIHVELMPPLDKDGNSPLWEAIGRRFMNMDYKEADKLSRTNKEFILSLYPKEAIYVTLLTAEARDAIGKVGPDTMPVKHMLESIGFNFNQEVDPFDGGPHYRCKLNNIKPIQSIRKAQVVESLEENYVDKSILLKLESSKENKFCVLKLDVKVSDDKNEIKIELNKNIIKTFSLTLGQKLDIMDI
jgi:arginine N-succinyltransferase